VWRGVPLPLTRLECELIAHLGSEPNRVWTYGKLFAAVWGGAYLGDNSILHSAVKRLRRKLRAVSGGPSIETVRGIGYRLVSASPSTT
jgi:DNA-binding response OmpR family regulator